MGVDAATPRSHVGSLEPQQVCQSYYSLDLHLSFHMKIFYYTSSLRMLGNQSNSMPTPSCIPHNNSQVHPSWPSKQL
uniref:Uncharacterized protein n=1 Tax=Physcomitrium patens TaxID=3218 RepID=A0A2K1IY64_PHYPA|nr:hypothetical protein PHYPA_024032 [Physcomitrium patens]